MSKPTTEELFRLKVHQENKDDEAYHSEFDDLLEEKLKKLDPEWISAMNVVYVKSDMSRWYA